MIRAHSRHSWFLHAFQAYRIPFIALRSRLGRCAEGILGPSWGSARPAQPHADEGGTE